MKKVMKLILSYLPLVFIFILLLSAESQLTMVEQSALSTFLEINLANLVIAILISYSIAVLLTTFVIDFLKLWNSNADRIFLGLSSIIFTIVLSYELLKILTEEQFGLLGTFIGFPLVSTFPRLIRQVAQIFEKKEIKWPPKNKPKN